MTKAKPRNSMSKTSVRRLVGLQRAIQTGRTYRIRPDDGHAYILSYESGVVKVGSTANPMQRFGALKRQANAHDNRIVDARLSWIHKGYVDTERQLLAYCRENGVACGSEFFRISFADVDAYSRTISYFDIAAYEATYARLTTHLDDVRETMRIARLGSRGDGQMNLVEAYERGLAMAASTDQSP